MLNGVGVQVPSRAPPTVFICFFEKRRLTYTSVLSSLRYFTALFLSAQLVELADTLGLEPSAARHGGSTPSLGTSSFLGSSQEALLSI